MRPRYAFAWRGAKLRRPAYRTHAKAHKGENATRLREIVAPLYYIGLAYRVGYFTPAKVGAEFLNHIRTRSFRRSTKVRPVLGTRSCVATTPPLSPLSDDVRRAQQPAGQI
jgi:hypothetical protein